MKLKEIAAKANVSISTVSRIINNQGNFSEETRRKVMEIAKEYLKPGVTPSKIGGAFYTIAVFVPEVHDFVDNDPASSADLSHLKEEFEASGHRFLLATHSRGAQTSGSSYRMLRENQVDAAVVFDSFVDDRLVDELIGQGIPYLVTNGRRYDRVQNFIDYDNRKGAYEVIRYLHRLGHRKIGLIAGPEDHLVSRNRLVRLQRHDGLRGDEGLVRIEAEDSQGHLPGRVRRPEAVRIYDAAPDDRKAIPLRHQRTHRQDADGAHHEQDDSGSPHQLEDGADRARVLRSGAFQRFLSVQGGGMFPC
nr:LacI family DNA-binding transcriptional regulator [Cohnella sp. AR92]